MIDPLVFSLPFCFSYEWMNACLYFEWIWQLNLENKMSHRKFEHPRHGSLGFLPRKRASRHRGKGDPLFFVLFCSFLLFTFRFKWCVEYSLLIAWCCFGVNTSWLFIDKTVITTRNWLNLQSNRLIHWSNRLDYLSNWLKCSS